MISTKGRYALRIMLDIAANQGESLVRVKDISTRQDISMKYLENIINTLCKGGLLVSSRGPRGGYKLTKAPYEYLVGDIIRLTEGSMAPVSCLETDKNECLRKDNCATLRLWQELNDAIVGVIDKYTLADLLEWQNVEADSYII